MVVCAYKINWTYKILSLIKNEFNFVEVFTVQIEQLLDSVRVTSEMVGIFLFLINLLLFIFCLVKLKKNGGQNMAKQLSTLKRFEKRQCERKKKDWQKAFEFAFVNNTSKV